MRPDELFPIVIADPPYLPSAQSRAGRPTRRRRSTVARTGWTWFAPASLWRRNTWLRTAVVLLQVAGERQADEVTEIVDRDPALGLSRVELRSADAERAVLLLSAAAGTRPAPSPH